MGSSTSEMDGPQAAAPGDLIGVLEQGRRQFLALVDHVRPELHRYCTRMTREGRQRRSLGPLA